MVKVNLMDLDLLAHNPGLPTHCSHRAVLLGPALRGLLAAPEDGPAAGIRSRTLAKVSREAPSSDARVGAFVLMSQREKFIFT
jgi:hypothetical protein